MEKALKAVTEAVENEGLAVPGVVDRGDADTGYSERWDSYFSVSSRQWLGETCSDPGCEFCAERPADASGEFH